MSAVAAAAGRLPACPIALLQDSAEATLKFSTSAGEVSGREELYRPLLQALAKGPRPLADLLPAVPGLTLPGALEAVSRLLQGGAVGLYVPEANQKPATRACQRLNRALVKDGQPLPDGEVTQAELTARLADVPTRILPLPRRLGGVSLRGRAMRHPAGPPRQRWNHRS